MFKLESEEAVLATFRPRDRKWVELVPGMTLPVIVRDYLSWLHPAGGRAYLVFAVPGGVPTGVVFETNGGGGPSVPQMCDWCHCPGMGTQVGLLVAQLNSKKRVGVHICSDLGCKRKIEDEANRSGRSPIPALEKLVLRMGRFASEALKIDLTTPRH